MNANPLMPRAGQPPHLEVRATQHKGWGVFTKAAIPCGARVLAMEGEQFASSAVPPESMAMQIGEDLWLCSDGSALDDYINHSCEPNVGFARDELALYALREIEAGEELAWDYSTSISECDWSMDCRCGAVNCRGVILPFGSLAFEQRVRLATFALPYLRDRVRGRG